jgi:hypothetical protein
MVGLMARKNTPTKPRTGRPPKSAEPTVDRVTLRLTRADRELLDSIQAQEQEAASRLGITLSSADALRIALRREAERRGLVEASPVAKAS